MFHLLPVDHVRFSKGKFRKFSKRPPTSIAELNASVVMSGEAVAFGFVAVAEDQFSV
jgi:hypothetical protein